MKLRLTARIVLYFMVLVAVLLAVVGALSYRSGSTSLKAAAISEMLAKAVEKEAALNTWLEERLSDCRKKSTVRDFVVKATRLIAAAPASEEARSAHAELLEELEPEISGANSDFIEIFVIQLEGGRVVASTRPGEEGKSKIGHPYFEHGKTAEYMQLPYRSVDLLAPAITLALPLRATNGLVVAVLAARLNLATLDAIAQRRTMLHQTEDSFLINADKFPVTQPLFLREPVVLRRRFDSEAVRLCAAHQSGVTLAPDYRGVPSIAVYRWNAKTQLGLIVKIDQAEALAPARAFGRSVILISSLALLATLGLAFLLARTITRPLYELKEGMKRFAEGSVEAQLLETSGDEVGLLAQEFNQMAARVSERNAEIAKANHALQTENAERKKAELEAQHQAAFARLNPNPVLELSACGEINYFNDAASEMASVLQCENLDEMPPPNTDVIVRECLATGKPKLRVETPIGGRLLSWSFFPVMFNNTVHCYAGDITERKQAEEVLQQRVKLQDQLVQISATVPGLIYSLLMHPDGSTRMPFASGTLIEIFDLQPEDVREDATPLFSLIHPDDIGHVRATMAESARTLNPWRDDFRVSRSGLGEIWVEGHSVPQREPDGSTLWHGFVQNITQRKRAEEALQLSNVLLSTQQEATIDGILVVDENGQIVSFNRRFLEIWGIPPTLVENRVHGPVLDYVAPQLQDPGSFLARVQYLYENRHETSRDELTLVGGRILDRYSAPLFGPKERYYGRVWYFRDITESKHSEEKLRQLSRAVEQSSCAIVITDAAGRIEYVNSKFMQVTGYTVAEVLGKNPSVLKSGHTSPEAYQELWRTITAGKEWRGEFSNKKKSGELYCESASISAIRDLAGRITHYLAVKEDITEQKQADAALEKAHQALVDMSRQAGMAEIATNVLHNVGNVLNSVNVSAGLIAEGVKKSKASSLARVVALLQEHAQDLGAFITQDSRGKHVPAHLAQLSQHLQAEQEANVRELELLRRNVDHVKEIVAMQQSYASFGGVKETVNLVHLVEDSLRMNEGAFSRHEVQIIREFGDVPQLNGEKHKILQILVNLLRNAKHACDESLSTDRRITVRVAKEDGRVKISVIDNGVGILPENLTRIFNHGFTTRKNGHGFGLHSGALAAKEMGGSLTVQSGGPGLGAAFTLELPCEPPEQVSPEKLSPNKT